MSAETIQYVGMWASIGVTAATGVMAFVTYLMVRSARDQVTITDRQLTAFRQSVSWTTRYNLSVEEQSLNRLLIEYPHVHNAFAQPSAYDGLPGGDRLRADTIAEIWLLHYETLFEAWPILSPEAQELYENAVTDCIRRYPLLGEVLRRDASSASPVWCRRLREVALRSSGTADGELAAPTVA